MGSIALMRVDAPNGVIEIGYVTFSDHLKRTRMATEAIYLLMNYVFNVLGYRRLEWKCDALNAPSRKSALRLGFVFEGIFRQAAVVKGKNRDTAWFSMLDKEFFYKKHSFIKWLSADNFDTNGTQLTALAAN